MLLHHAATTVMNVINLHCPCATERSQGMPLWKLLTTSILFVRSYIHKAQHTKRGTKSVWTGQVHLGLEPNKQRTWTTLGLGFLPFGRTQEFTNRTHLLCLQQTGVQYRESWAQGCHYTFNVKSIEPCLAVSWHEDTLFPEPMPPLTFYSFCFNFYQLWVKFLKFLNNSGQLAVPKELKTDSLTASLVYAQNPWWDPWWWSQSSSRYEPQCNCAKRNGTFGVQKEGFKQWTDKLIRICTLSWLTPSTSSM